MSAQEKIDALESEGRLDPECPGCLPVYDALLAGKGWPFQPSHKASSRCESGKHPHCTCDTCF